MPSARVAARSAATVRTTTRAGSPRSADVLTAKGLLTRGDVEATTAAWHAAAACTPTRAADPST